MKFDHSKLKGLMRVKGMTQSTLSQKIGITEMTLFNKLSGRSDFTCKEIYAIMLALGIEDPRPYFFAL